MSSGSDLWRLYPKRSITSHSICGSGPLFPGLRSEKRRAESGMAELPVVARNTGSDGARISRLYSDVKGILQNEQIFDVKLQNRARFQSKTPAILQNRRHLMLTMQMRASTICERTAV
jgi:hypothetical protein